MGRTTGAENQPLEGNRRTCVIFNPAAARKRAQARLEYVQEQWKNRAAFWPTEQPGHAEELAVKAVEQGFEIIAAAGGDGTVHEVANGILKTGNTTVAFALIPIGSANDYAFSLQWACQQAGPDKLVDIGLVRGGGKERYFVNSLGLGFSCAVALDSRRIPWLQGVPLYGLAFLRSLLFRYQLLPMNVVLDHHVRVEPTLSITFALGRREGNLVVAPRAQLDDGSFDYLHVGALSRWRVLRYLPRLARGGELPEHPVIWQGKCRSARLHSDVPLDVHLDGEFFCTKTDGITELDIQIRPNGFRVRFPFNFEISG